jgi:hypothetical protein
MNLAREAAYQSDQCAHYAQKVFEDKSREPDSTLNTAEYISLLKAFLGIFEHAFIVVDALDEAAEKESIVETVTNLLSLSQESSATKPKKSSIKVLLASREVFQVHRIVWSLAHVRASRLSLHEMIHEDVEFYVKMEIQSRLLIGKLKLRNKELVVQIQDTIIQRAGT